MLASDCVKRRSGSLRRAAQNLVHDVIKVVIQISEALPPQFSR
jgi:hypothetical protein